MEDLKTREPFKCRYQTAPKEISKQTLPDGNHIKLSATTKVLVNYSETRRRIRLLNGEAQISICEEVTWPFIVESRQALIRTHKATFNIDQRYGVTEVTVLEGNITVSPIKQNKNRAEIKKGEMLKVTEHNTGAIKDFEVSSYKDWGSGFTKADNIRLTELLISLNRFTNTPLVTRDQNTSRLLVSGVYDLNHIEDTVLCLSKSYNLKVTKEESHTVLELLPE
ncbi:FecR family protein [Microbulbifer sp. JTAC008]|uniref:FecR family protein n=1 Tax=unclassified Microbulbifer TaxID=2619833 RepID=UPI0040398E91